MRSLWWIAFATAMLVWAQATLELQGRVEEVPARASVTLFGTSSPYSASTTTDSKGRFRFRNLAAGSYTLSVFVPGRGEVRRTVVVSKSLADPKGIVRTQIDFKPDSSSETRALEQQSSVSVRRLSIPSEAARRYEQAEKRLGRREVDGALVDLKEAVRVAPQFMSAWNLLGVISYQTRKYEDAEKYFRQALETEPGAFEPVVNLGGVLLNLGKFDEALQYNRYATLQRPGDALANSQLGLNYFHLGHDEQAETYLRKAERIDPAHFSAPQLTLAQIYYRRGDREAVCRELESYLKLHPDAPNAAAIKNELEKLKWQ